MIRQQEESYPSHKWNEVMFTHGEHIYVLHNHHLIMILIKYRVIQDIWIRKTENQLGKIQKDSKYFQTFIETLRKQKWKLVKFPF